MSALFESVERWAWNVAVKKIVVALVGFLVSRGIVEILLRFGVQIDSAKLQLELTAFGIGAFAAIHDWLKLKTGWAFL